MMTNPYRDFVVRDGAFTHIKLVATKREDNETLYRVHFEGFPDVRCSFPYMLLLLSLQCS